MRRKTIGMIATILAVMAMALSGCAGPVSLSDGSNSPNTSIAASAPGTGNLEIRVTDAPAKEEITKIDVTVKSIEIKRVGSGGNQPDITAEEGTTESDNTTDSNNGWTKIKFTEGEYPTFDLLTVKDNPETLASQSVENGSYKVRLEVESVMVTIGDNEPVEATVPSGKIKFNSAFNIGQGSLTVLTFDFDASRSVNVTGNGKGNSKVMFKPVIKLAVNHQNNGNEQGEPTEQTESVDITTEELPDGVAGEVYDNTTLAAVGGSGEYTWEITSGSLPDNLTMDAEGEISGDVDADSAGDYPFTVQATDKADASLSDTQELTMRINEKLEITTDSLPAGTIGQVYDSDNATLAAVGGYGEYTWAVTAGTLPDNLTLSDEGVISGTPAPDTEGEIDITITVMDSSSPAQTADKEFTITIGEAT